MLMNCCGVNAAWLEAVVGNSVNWMEAVETLTELSERHHIEMNEPVYFNEPYVGLDDMPAVVQLTYRSTRSKLYTDIRAP